MHVLISTGNAPGAPTGYGSQAMHLVRAALAADPCNTVTVMCWNVNLYGVKGFVTSPQMLPSPAHCDDFGQSMPALKRVMAELTVTDPDEAADWRRRVTWMPGPYPVGTGPPTRVPLAAINAIILAARADCIVFLQDVFIFQSGVAFACPSMSWIPLHFVPLEKATELVLASMEVHVAISGYGRALLQPVFGPREGRAAAAVKYIETIPHGRDARIFKPLPAAADWSDRGLARTRAARDACRRQLGWPVAVESCGGDGVLGGARAWPSGWDGAIHITLVVASNSEDSGRKALDMQLQGWIEFADGRERQGFPPEATILVLHSETARSYDLGRLLETFGELTHPRKEKLADPRGHTDGTDGITTTRVHVRPDTALASGLNKSSDSKPEGVVGTSDSAMAMAYCAADVLLAATASEGCGVPTLEAQLCGCPVVTNRTTAMPEQTLLGISAAVGPYIARVDFNSGWYLPNVQAVAAALAAIAAWTPAHRAQQVAATLPTLRARYDSVPVVQAWKSLFGRFARDVVAPWRTRVEAQLDAGRGSTVARLLGVPRADTLAFPFRPSTAATTEFTVPQWPLVLLPHERITMLVAARVASARADMAAQLKMHVQLLSKRQQALRGRFDFVTDALAGLRKLI